MLRRIISRLTMKFVRSEFVDKVDGREVNTYIDTYGDFWLANDKFSIRVKKNN
jgi:hypothetical protein